MVREVSLANFPYNNKIGKYLIHKEKQIRQIWEELFTSTLCCRGQTKNELIYRILFWLGIILAIIAIIVTLIKELFEGVKSEDTILHLSIGELVLAVLSVSTTLSKHLLKHSEVVMTQKLLQSDERNAETKKAISQRRKVRIILGVTLVIFIGVILIGFVVMHTKDDQEHAYLTYTKFTTVITLFMSIILDGIINDILSDFHSIIKIDQCRIVLHQIHAELNDLLIKEGNQKRADEIQKFLLEHEIFSIQGSNHIKFVAPNQVVYAAQGEDIVQSEEMKRHRVSDGDYDDESNSSDMTTTKKTNTPLMRNNDVNSDWV